MTGNSSWKWVACRGYKGKSCKSPRRMIKGKTSKRLGKRVEMIWENGKIKKRIGNLRKGNANGSWENFWKETQKVNRRGKTGKRVKRNPSLKVVPKCLKSNGRGKSMERSRKRCRMSCKDEAKRRFDGSIRNELCKSQRAHHYCWQQQIRNLRHYWHAKGVRLNSRENEGGEPSAS